MANVIWMLSAIFIIYCVISWAEGDGLTICNQKSRCNECITASKDCAWCNDEEFLGSRCSSKDDLDTRNCKDPFSPMNNATWIENEKLKDGDSAGTQDPVQLQPHRVKIKLRPGMEYRLPMTYRIADNLPIDMYFVLDFSTTMKSRLTDLAGLTRDLIDGLQSAFTKNIFIGFGSFLDKPVQPFHITTKEYLANPCVLNSGEVCKPSYGFIHKSKLNSDIDTFIDAIKNGETSANFDPMEGGLDAVLQASVCPDIIGWRQQSRRVMVYISDSGFHFAGDGKLAGIDKPNDGICHLESRGAKGQPGEFIYTQSKEQDYPSLGHVKEVLAQNKINAFFLVDSSDKQMYTYFSNMIKQAKTNTMDQEGAQGIVQSITKFYTDISKKVTMSGEGIPDEMVVHLESDCASGGVKNTRDLKTEVFECTDLVKGKEVTFNVIMSVNECPAADANGHIPSKTFKIHPEGLQESLEIDVEYICDCNCTKDEQLDQSVCTRGNGTYECGVCKCNEGRSGDKCQCNNTMSDISHVQEANCKMNNESNLCENNGNCKCGQCTCYSQYQGKYCECDTDLCRPSGGELCGGKAQGKCVCDKCSCTPGYTGKFCDCAPNSECLGKNGIICSGNGTCKCGKCTCENNYSGAKCDKCLYQRCDKCTKCAYADCVKCLGKNKSGYNSTAIECQKDCANVTVTRVDSFLKDTPCLFIDATDCSINYLVVCGKGTGWDTLQIAKTERCYTPPNALFIAMPLLGGIIGVGLLLLLIWKILTSFYDKIEYARFEHECQNPKWSKMDNPLYQTPVTTNQNPMFQATVD